MSANGMQFIHIYIFYSRSPLSLSLWCFWAHTSHFASRGRSAESHHKNYPLKLCSVNKFYIVCTWQLAQWLPRKMKYTHAFCAGRHSVVANNHVRVQARHNTIATPLITVATALPIFGAPVNAWRTKFPPLDECESILSRTVFRVASAHQTLDGKLLQLTIKLAYFSHVWLCGLFECVLYVFSLNPKMNSALAERAMRLFTFLFFCANAMRELKTNLQLWTLAAHIGRLRDAHKNEMAILHCRDFSAQLVRRRHWAATTTTITTQKTNECWNIFNELVSSGLGVLHKFPFCLCISQVQR